MPASVAPSVGQRPRHGSKDAPNSVLLVETRLNVCHIAGLHNPLGTNPGTGQTLSTYLEFSTKTGTPWEVHVGALMIRCPNTGQPISTGIETDEYSLKQIEDVPASTRCPFCGLDHTWWKREAWLADQPQQPLLQSSEGRTLDKTA